MKWVPVMEKVKVRARAFGLRWFPVLLAVISLLLIAGANNKWRG